jgi:UDP-glucuronate 4-epimerase
MLHRCRSLPFVQILVTGAAGFIGSHLAEALVRRGDQVVGLDDLNPYYDPSTKRRNLAAIERSSATENFTSIIGDIRDKALIDPLFDEFRFDAVAHLAAMPGVRASTKDPLLYLDVNMNGTVVLLEAARKAENSPNFVFASSSSVYGDSTDLPFEESARCDRPQAPYPASKRAGEILGNSYHQAYGQDFTALRFFTVYGPRNRPDMFAFKLADNISKGTEVVLYDPDRMKRDWTFVDDIVAGTVAAIDKRLGYEVINLGRGEPVLLADFVRQIEESTGKTATVTAAPKPPEDMISTHADISKARRLLDYKPSVGLGEGVAAFLDWYRQEVSASTA